MMSGVKCVAIIAALGVAGAAHAAPIGLVYDAFVETKVLTTPVDTDSQVLLSGRINRTAGPATGVSESFFFTAGSSDLALRAGWRIAPSPSRLLGVNIDLRDRFNTVIASDTFEAVTNNVAASRLLFSGLAVGSQYEILLTGSPIGNALFGINLSGGSALPDIPLVPQVVPPDDRALFDTLSGTKASFSLGSGDTFRIDGKIAEAGSVRNNTVLSVTDGTVSAGITWLVDRTPAGLSGLFGVNVDLLDSFGTVIASDTFQGLNNGQAFSQLLATGLAPGDYRLHLTGITDGGAVYRIILGTSEMPPEFTPIPEPASWTLSVVGLAGLVSTFYRRRDPWRRPNHG